jgi:hypothetical protein
MLGLDRRLEEPIADVEAGIMFYGDVFLPALRLIIEVDGYHHQLLAAQVWRDARKTLLCRRKGLEVLRVPNADARRLSDYALAERLRPLLEVVAGLRGLVWRQVLMNGALSKPPANDNE